MKTFDNNINSIKDAKELLITIDMINGFVKEGNLAAPSIKRIIPRQQEILKEAVEDNKTGIIFIRDSHQKDSVELKRYAEHCLAGSWESEVIDELKDFTIYSLSFFKNNTNLTYVLQDTLSLFKNLEKVKLMGCLSDICVLHGALGLRNYFDEVNRDVDVMVYEDAIDTFDAPNHQADLINQESLRFMENNGVKVIKKVK